MLTLTRRPMQWCLLPKEAVLLVELLILLLLRYCEINGNVTNYTMLQNLEFKETKCSSPSAFLW